MCQSKPVTQLFVHAPKWSFCAHPALRTAHPQAAHTRRARAAVRRTVRPMLDVAAEQTFTVAVSRAGAVCGNGLQDWAVGTAQIRPTRRRVESVVNAGCCRCSEPPTGSSVVLRLMTVG